MSPRAFKIMVDAVFTMLVAIWFAFLGTLIGGKAVEMSLMERCEQANPTVQVGDIEQFCKDRLYIKEEK